MNRRSFLQAVTAGVVASVTAKDMNVSSNNLPLEMEDIIGRILDINVAGLTRSSTRITLHPAQQQVKREARRFNVLDCGRRWGKSLYLGDLLIETAEQGWPAGYFAPSYKLLTETWRQLIEATEGIRSGKSEQEHRIEFPNGGVIECWSLDSEGGGTELSRKKYKAGRSRKYKRVAIDEAALIPSLMQVFNYAIAPTLIDLKGDAWFGSTPMGKGDFFKFYLYGQKDSPFAKPGWMSWKMPTRSNPYIPLDEIERAKQDYPADVFAQEYEADFLEDAGQVFRNIAACTVLSKDIWQTEPIPFHVYVTAWDLAKKQDFSVMGVIDCTTKSLVYIDRFNYVEYMQQIPRLIALVERFQPVEVIVEENGNLALMEMLQQTRYKKRGHKPYIERRDEFPDFSIEELLMAEAALKRIEDATSVSGGWHDAYLPITKFHVTNATKEEAVQALVLAFEREEIKIPDFIPLITELEAFGMERTAAGAFRYSAPAGEHDDTVMMLAEGWYRARRYMAIEALPLREKALRALSPELKPENIAKNPNPMAYSSQDYWVKSYEKSAHGKKKTGLFGGLSNFGR